MHSLIWPALMKLSVWRKFPDRVATPHKSPQVKWASCVGHYLDPDVSYQTGSPVQEAWRMDKVCTVGSLAQAELPWDTSTIITSASRISRLALIYAL